MTAASKKRRELVEDGLLSVQEAKEWSGLAVPTLYRMMAARQLPFVKIGGRRLIPRRALVELAAENLKGAGLDD